MRSRPRVLSFDCFGTLIDWRFGQERVLRQLPSLREAGDRLAEVAHAREAIEQELEREAWRPYREILADSLTRSAQQVLGVTPTPREAEAFAAGQLGWPAFAEVPDALRRLAAAYPLALLSNCDEEVLRLAARKHLGVPIQHFISAEAVQSYKPQPAHWEALFRLGYAPEDVLHVSFAREYDLDVAAQLGTQLGFVARYGLQPPADLPLTIAAQDLAGFADQLL